MPEVHFDYTPQPRQQLLHSTTARQILYGGAAGGGKSRSLRADGILFCLQNPGLQAYLFRRTLKELEDNHVKWLRTEIPKELGTYNYTRNEFSFFNGSMLNFCYCEKEKDVTRYQGAEMHWVGIDEAAHFTDFQINYLKTRNRLGGFRPLKDKDRLPRFAMGSNPGGPGHNYLKSIFIDKSPPETIFFDDTMRNPRNPEDKGWPSIFIPAKMSDNAYLDENYEASFGGLSPELADALRDGDWDAVVGKALHNLSRERHQLRPFKPPRHWTHFQVIDWGTASPFSVGWYVVSEGATLKGKDGHPPVWLPEGSIIRFKEWYGWDGRPNKGSRMSAQHVARGIIEKEQDLPSMDYRVGDTDMWADRGARSVQEIMEETEPTIVLRKAKKDRTHNYAEMVSRLAGNPSYREDGEEDDPMFFCTSNCIHFWRTVPTLTLDETDPEKGPATDGEDHVYDEVAYACRSREYVSTERDRYDELYGEQIRAARGEIEDPYAVA